tara:strand:- start:60 stop:944 length:885 start_codon:yes stop_codon:yes gene_type:complete
MKKNNQIRPRRSFIFTPPFKFEMFQKVLSSNVDIICLELEDGVHPNEKETARNAVIKNINKNNTSTSAEILIRINSIREKFGIEDILALLNSKKQPDGIMMPKVRTPDEILILDNLLEEAGKNTKLHIIIETNEGLKNVYDIAACSDKIETLFFGGVDMSAELRCKNIWEALLYARSRIVNAAAANHLDVIDVPFLDLKDMKTMKLEAKKSKDLGFTGKGTIHPKQIDIINKVFTPSNTDISKAKRIINEFEKSNKGLLVVDGKLIEKPVLRDMYRIIKIGDKIKDKKKNNILY